MTTTSQAPAVIDWLVNAAKASPLLGAATPAVSVFDGPQPPVATQALAQVLWIGCDPAQPADKAAESAGGWPVMDHARTREEHGTITCAAQHWSGDPASKVHRDGAAAIMGGVELLLRGDGTTGPGDASMGDLVFWSAVGDSVEWYPRQLAGGVACLVVFTVSYYTRLTTTGP
jgi:hypothetical protein